MKSLIEPVLICFNKVIKAIMAESKCYSAKFSSVLLVWHDFGSSSLEWWSIIGMVKHRCKHFHCFHPLNSTRIVGLFSPIFSLLGSTISVLKVQSSIVELQSGLLLMLPLPSWRTRKTIEFNFSLLMACPTTTLVIFHGRSSSTQHTRSIRIADQEWKGMYGTGCDNPVNELCFGVTSCMSPPVMLSSTCIDSNIFHLHPCCSKNIMSIIELCCLLWSEGDVPPSNVLQVCFVVKSQSQWTKHYWWSSWLRISNSK